MEGELKRRLYAARRAVFDLEALRVAVELAQTRARVRESYAASVRAFVRFVAVRARLRVASKPRPIVVDA